MFKTLFLKEILENFTSRRFIIVCLLAIVLIPLGFYISAKEYHKSLHDYQESVRLYQADHKLVSDVLYKEGGKAFRRPSPLRYLSDGFERTMSTAAETRAKYHTLHAGTSYNNRRNLGNIYEYLYGPMDLSFIVSTLLTFLAMIFTYGAISREKEMGTLRQTLSNAVPRYSILLAKVAANFIALLLPVLASLALGWLLLLAMGFSASAIPGTSRITFMAIIFIILIIGVFFNLGLLISAMTKKAVTSIITLLLCWVFLYAVFPRLSIVLSRVIYPVKSEQTLNMERSQIRADNSASLDAAIDEYVETSPYSRPYPEAYHKEQEGIRAQFQQVLIRQLEDIERDAYNKRSRQNFITTQISRISPVSCCIRPMTELAHTGMLAFHEYRNSVRRYITELNENIYYKQRVTHYQGGIGSSFTGNMKDQAPQFDQGSLSFETVMQDILPDLALLILFNILFFAGASVAFLRYDVR